MFKMWLGGSRKEKSALEGLDMDKALKKIPTKELSILTFKQLREHVDNCSASSEANLKVLKLVGWMVAMLALEKLNEMFHFVQKLPTLGG